jgi:hypothetical protein
MTVLLPQGMGENNIGLTVQDVTQDGLSHAVRATDEVKDVVSELERNAKILPEGSQGMLQWVANCDGWRH